MRIEKKFQGELPDNKLVGTKTTSDTDGYTCNYINNLCSGVLYVTSNTFTAPFDGYFTINFVGSGWGYAGEQRQPSTSCTQGGATLVSSAIGAVKGHDTTPDANSGMWVYEVKKDKSYTFSLSAGFNGGAISEGWIRKLEPKYKDS